MKIKLRTFQEDSNTLGRYYRFAVIDLEKSSEYPQNFVCLLPTTLDNASKTQTKFFKIFGDKSAEQAERLLVEALRNEDEREVRTEIERRLAQINPKKYFRKRCIECRDMFYPRKKLSLKYSLCQDCLTKKADSKRLTGRQALL